MWGVAGLVASVLLVGCGAESGAPRDDADAGRDAAVCEVDEDLDGYASAACGGPDCDDGDAALWQAAECQARCAADERAPRCPCAVQQPEVCYAGPEGTASVGECVSGLRSCLDGAWTPCEGEQRPTDEYCDGLDNDCDGESDEGVSGECGNCDSECVRLCAGQTCDRPFEGVEGLVVERDGCLTLGAETVEAEATLVFVGPEEYTQWGLMQWEVVRPRGTSIRFDVRASRSEDGLAQETWLWIDTQLLEASLPEVQGLDTNARFLEVRITLRGEDGNVPRMCRITVDSQGLLLI